jgi:hypothetical protein
MNNNNKSKTKIKTGVKSASTGHHSSSTPTPQTDIHDSTVHDKSVSLSTTQKSQQSIIIVGRDPPYEELSSTTWR